MISSNENYIVVVTSTIVISNTTVKLIATASAVCLLVVLGCSLTSAFGTSAFILLKDFNGSFNQELSYS